MEQIWSCIITTRLPSLISRKSLLRLRKLVGRASLSLGTYRTHPLRLLYVFHHPSSTSRIVCPLSKYPVISTPTPHTQVLQLIRYQIVEAATKTFNRIDHLISNAGICPFHPFLTLPHPLWHRVQSVNLNGAFYIIQAVANIMSTQEPIDGERGNIIAISSISALMGGGEQTHYTPTKAGLKSLMESCAIALGPLGIRCNSVLPGEPRVSPFSLNHDHEL